MRARLFAPPHVPLISLTHLLCLTLDFIVVFLSFLLSVDEVCVKG